MTAAATQSAGRRRMVVVTTPELAPGYRLAGVATLAAATASEAETRLRELSDGEHGIVAVHEPFLAGLDPRERRRLEASASPLVVALPSGAADGGPGARREALLAMLWRAIGYQMTFPAGGEP